ncbi:MAG: AbrB family transcriptional regulator [Salaquimonas sp.]|nr:AbrB family transcriptional regulator [Salaquimonas sp.]
MTSDTPSDPGLLTRLPMPLRWALLVALSAVLAFFMELIGLPAALLLGAMAAGIGFGINGARMSVPQVPFIAAEAILACLIARAINADIVATFASGWALFLATVLTIIAASSFMGYLLARARVMPGTTAIWATSAGAATAMIMLADEYGADARLVGFMQYVRVVMVAIAASVIAAYVFGAGHGESEPIIWFPPTDWINLATMLAIALTSAAAGAVLRLPSGALLLPVITTSALHAAGWLTIELPQWLLAIAFAIIGWRVGLGFTRRILRHAAHALPQIAVSALALIAFCGLLGYLLTLFFDIDGLTAYLATSPGGLDSVAIIAASTPVDVPFVMALQTVRLIAIMALGPWIARMVARRLPNTV